MGINLSVFAQQKSRNTLNMYNISSYNPAVVGSTSYGDAFVGVRQQNMTSSDNENYGDLGASTQWLGVNMPLKKLSSGIGLVFSNDKIGFESTQDIKLSYAYQIKIGEGKLGLGIEFGILSYTFDLSEAIYPNGVSGSGSDSWLQQKYAASKESIIEPSIGGGVFYKSKEIYCGISTTQINEPKFDLSGNEVSYIERTYWITAGYNYQTSNPLWVIKPSALLKSNLNFDDGFNSVSQLSIDLLIQYNKFVIAGVCYTSSSDISPVLGIEINNGSKLDGLRVLGAYDISWSDLQSQHSGSLEVMIGYSFNLSIEKVTKSYKSVRFL